jgi:hypothetical protein
MSEVKRSSVRLPRIASACRVGGIGPLIPERSEACPLFRHARNALRSHLVLLASLSSRVTISISTRQR